MIEQQTLDAVKMALRIKHTALDEDISASIEACLKDLELCGVFMPNPDDPLILAAIKNYVRASYTDEPDQAARFTEAYEKQKACFMSASEYNGG